jgi:hypothetical protein
MKEKIDPQNRVGQRNQNTSGLWMEVIEYKTATDITVRFDANGQVVKNVTWRNFKTGSVANRAVPLRKNKEMRLGETRVMNNGLRATITEYHSAKNITVKFEDGVIVYKKTYYKFSLGEIGHPPIMFQNTLSLPEFSIGYYLNDLGFKKIKSGEWEDRGFDNYELDFYNEEKRIAVEYDGAIHNRKSSQKNEKIKNELCQKLGIRLYRIRDPYLKNNDLNGSTNYVLNKSDFIGHRLLDCKLVLENILTENNIAFDENMIDFRRDADTILDAYEETCVSAHARSRIGETVFSTTANQNMTLIAYHNSHNVDVKFDDGVVRKGIYYSQFLVGNVSHPAQLSIDYERLRIGEKKIMLNGLEAEICGYRTNKDIDVVFTIDGSVVRHINYNAFKKGRVGHPEYDSNFLINRNKKLGMIGQVSTGEIIKIVEYRGCYDIDVVFVESNKLVKHTTFDKFKKGRL